MGKSTPVAALSNALEGGRHQEFRQLVLNLDGAAVDETVIRYLDQYISHFHGSKRRIATMDPKRQPGDDELVVQFGNYPPSFESLAVNNPMRRNILDFWNVPWGFGEIESSACWHALDRIFVINRNDRPDRLYSVVRELSRVGVPLDRITRHPASIYSESNDGHVNGQIGCLTSHLQVCRAAVEGGMQNILVVEDDFGFIEDVDHVRGAAAEFFRRSYDYDVCLLATSKSGLIEPMDDLVSVTRQKCTNTGAYFASNAGSAKLVDCFSAARERLVATGNCKRYAVDRCWVGLQGERFLVFKRRLGFQLPSFSNIESAITAYLD